MSNSVLIVEDDTEIATIVAANLKDLDLAVEHVTDGLAGLEKVRAGSFRLIILDVMLPGMDGISVCAKIRESDPVTPILMLTARAEEIDRVMGLEIGADDYMTKPFSVRELTARIRALLRRAQVTDTTESDQVYRVGDLVVDTAKRKTTLKDKAIDLTAKEFDLLELFAGNPGRAYSRADLLNLVWGYQFQGYEHTVNTHINRLRNKIEPDPAHPTYLQTVWGVGYRFAENPGETQ